MRYKKEYVVKLYAKMSEAIVRNDNATLNELLKEMYDSMTRVIEDYNNLQDKIEKLEKEKEN